jgi:hypothetical protein
MTYMTETSQQKQAQWLNKHPAIQNARLGWAPVLATASNQQAHACCKHVAWWVDSAAWLSDQPCATGGTLHASLTGKATVE